MIPASELKVIVGVYGIPEANRKLIKFDTDLKALASSDPTVTLHAEVDRTGFEEFAIYKTIAEEGIVSTLHAEVDNTGFEEFGVKKAIAEEGITSTLHAEVDDLGFEEFALKKHIATDPVTAELRAQAEGIGEVMTQIAAIREATAKPIVQEVELRIDKSSLATLGAEEAAIGAATNGNGNGNGNGGTTGGILGGLLAGRSGGKGFLPTALWGGHGSGGVGPWWMRALLGGGLLAGAGSLGSFAGFGAEHFLFTGLGLAGSAGAGALGGGLIGAGALGTMAVGGGSDMAVMKSTIGQVSELSKRYDALQEAVALYGAHSKQAAKASADLHLAMQEMGPAAKAELAVAKQGDKLSDFWNQQTAKARIGASHILEQVVGLGHDYVPLVAHAAERNLAIVNRGLKPLFSWLEGPEGTGIFKHLEDEFAHNLPTAMHAFDQGAQFVLKTINVASEYTGGFMHKVDEFFTKWNEPQNFTKWEGEIGHLVGDFHLWMTLIKELGRDIFDLFSQDAHTGTAIVTTITDMLHKLGEWERSVSGKQELHNLFEVHREEIVALLHVIPPLIGAIAPIYMTVAPAATEAMTEILGVAAEFLHLLDQTGPFTRWALGLALIGGKLFGFKKVFGGLFGLMWSPFKSLLAKAPVIGGFFETQVSETEALTAATEGLTTAVEGLTTAYETMGGAAADAQLSLFAETTAAESAAADAGQLSLFPMGAGLATGEASAGTATAAESAGSVAGDAAGAGLLAGISSTLRNGLGIAAGAAGGYFAAEFSVKAIEGITGKDFLENQSLIGSLTHGFNTEHVAETEAKALSQAKASDTGEHLLDELRKGMVTRLPDILSVSRQASREFIKGLHSEPEVRAAAASNMLAVIRAIKAGEKQGAISVEQGQKEIAHYLREYHLVSGNDPFHIAAAFTHTWAEAGHVSEQGISRALAELRKLPPASQAIAEQTMLKQVKEFERGGQLARGTFARLRSAIVTELQHTREHGGAQVQRFAEEFEGSIGTLPISVAESMENIGQNVGALLEQLGAHNPLQSFTVHYLHGHGHQAGSGNKFLNEISSFGGHQRGGHIDIGAPSGDSVPAMLERGEYVLNRNAVAAVGVQNLNSLNYGAHARFQHGGHVGGLGPEPQIAGPSGALETVGQQAIHDVYHGAQEYLAKHKPKVTSDIAMPGGGGDVVAQIARVLFANGFNKVAAAGIIGNAYRESGWNPAAVGTGGGGLWGFTSGAISLAALQAAARRAHVPWSDVPFQTAFMLRHGGLGLRSRLNSAGSAGDSARIFMEDWERPGIPALADREAGARKALAMGYAEGGLVQREEERYGVPQSGSSNSGSGPKYTGAGYVYPFAHASVNWGRIDEGVDFTGTGPIQAIGTGVVTSIMPNWYLNQSLVNYKLLEGPKAGKYVYVAEGITGIPSVGQHVSAGEVIASFAHGTANDSIETGWGAASGNGTLAGGGSGATAAGRSFYGFLKQLAGGGGWHGTGTAPFEKPTEKVPGVFEGAHTHSLSFPTVPKTLHGIKSEIHRWEGQLRIYRHAAGAAKGKPKTQRAIQANITAIEKHLRELRHARSQLREAVARKRFSQALQHGSKRLGIVGLSRISERQPELELRQRDYEIAAQFAEQVVGLEPQEPIAQPFPEQAQGESEKAYEAKTKAVEAANRKTEEDYIHGFDAYVESRERPAYGNVLDTLARWRNTAISAEQIATGAERNWEAHIHVTRADISQIDHYIDKVRRDVENYRKHEPKGALPAWIRDEIGARERMRAQLPRLRSEESELEKTLGEGREAFYGGAPFGIGNPVNPPQPPLAGTGTFEQSLQEVQGIHWPDEHELLASLPQTPVAGYFGGSIWQTQAAIEELGLKVAQANASSGGAGTGGAASPSSEQNSEREHLLEELLLQAHQREAIAEIERKTLSSAHILPYAGAYESGGVVAALVGERGPEIAAFPTGTRIHNNRDTSSMLNPHVTVHIYEGEQRAQVEIDGQKVSTARTERHAARAARRGLARAGT